MVGGCIHLGKEFSLKQIHCPRRKPERVEVTLESKACLNKDLLWMWNAELSPGRAPLSSLTQLIKTSLACHNRQHIKGVFCSSYLS